MSIRCSENNRLTPSIRCRMLWSSPNKITIITSLNLKKVQLFDCAWILGSGRTKEIVLGDEQTNPGFATHQKSETKRNQF